MQQVNPYLTFNGNCREAMTFYQRCLGGELRFQTLAESPMAKKMSKKMRECIVHSQLVRERLVLMGSDMVEENGLIRGNTVSLILHCDTEEEIKKAYQLLSDGGEQTHPLEVSFWGALFGNLTDKFGNHWLLHYESKLISKQQQ